MRGGCSLPALPERLSSAQTRALPPWGLSPSPPVPIWSWRRGWGWADHLPMVAPCQSLQGASALTAARLLSPPQRATRAAQFLFLPGLKRI